MTPRLLIPVAAACAALLAASSPVFAQDVFAPTNVAPTNGKTVKQFVPFTFKVHLDPSSTGSGVFIKVSRSKRVGDDGTLASNIYFRSMTQGANGQWTKKVEKYPYLKSHFLNRKGRYYWQAYVIDCSGGTDDCNVEGPIGSFRVK
jgi:hypothetical protein